MYPFRRKPEDRQWTIFIYAADGYLLRCFDSGTDPIRFFDGGRVGVWGRAAQSRANVLDNLRNYERLCGQRIPQTLSLVRFLCGHKK